MAIEGTWQHSHNCRWRHATTGWLLSISGCPNYWRWSEWV